MSPHSLRAALHFSGAADPAPKPGATEPPHLARTLLTVDTNDYGRVDSISWLTGALHRAPTPTPRAVSPNASFSSTTPEESVWHRSACLRRGRNSVSASSRSPSLTPKSCSSTRSRLVASLQEAVFLSHLMEPPQNCLHPRPRCPSEFESDGEDDDCGLRELLHAM
eukprot:EG_transcript_15361